MKSKIKKILCPIDFTAASTNAMDYAAKLSKDLNASLTLWNMCEIPIIDEIASQNYLLNAMDRKQGELSKILQDWCEEIKGEHDIPCGYYISSSIENLEKTLAHYTDGENFDLIVAGTNGADTIYQFFFGTNSYRIIKEVKCPVMIIPEGYLYKEMKSVVFATDYSLSDAKLAKRLIRTFNTNITFLHLSKTDSHISKAVFGSFKNIFEDEAENSYRVHFERMIYENKLDSLVEKMIEKSADMVIMSTEYRGWFEDLFHKSFTKKIVEGIQIPALVFHQKNEQDFSISLED